MNLPRILQRSALILFCSALLACGGGSSSAPPSSSLEANVIKGPVDGASCQLFDGNGVAVSDVAVSSDGRVRLTNIQGEAPFELRCEGGAYLDEATGLQVDASGVVLRSYLTDFTPVTVSPLTELAYRLAMTDGNVDDFDSFLSDVADEFALDGDNLLVIVPTNPLNNVPDVGTDAGRYGVMLAGLAQMMHDRGDSLGDLLDLLQSSMADGSLTDSGDPAGLALQQALGNLANSTVAAGSNINVSLVTPLDSQLGEAGDGGPQAKQDQAALVFTDSSVEKTWGDVPFSNPLSGGSGEGAVTYSSTDESVATVDNNGQVTLISSGSTTISAIKAEDALYLEASTSFTLTVSKASQASLSFTDSNIEKTWGNAPFSNPLSGGSGEGAVTYSSTDESVATVGNNGEVTLVGSGSTTISALKASDPRYLEASTNFTLTVSKAAQSALSFFGASINKTWGDAPFSNPLSGGSGEGAVSYSSTDESVATVDNNGEVTLVGSGSTTISALKAGDSRYLETSTSFTLMVSKAAQSALSFSEASINKTWGDAPFSNPLSGGSGAGAVTYSSTDESVATVDNNGQVTLISSGSTTISAIKAEDALYLEASTSFTLTVSKASQASLSFTDSNIEKTWGNAPFSNPLSGGSGEGAVTYSSTDESVATVGNNGEVTLVGSGSTTISALKASDPRYLAASTSFTLTVSKAAQSTLSFSEASINKTWGDAAFTNPLSGGSGEGAVTYSSTDESVATVDNNGEVTLVASGSTTISALKASDARYLEASTSFTLTVSQAAQSALSFSEASINKTWGDVPFSNPLSGGSGEGAVTYSSTDESVATVDNNGEVALVASGSTTISALKASDARYLEASTSFTLVVSKATQSALSFSEASINKTWGDAAFTNPLSGGSGEGAVTYSSTDESVATVDNNGEVTLVSSGSVTISAVKASDLRYLEASASFTLTVSKAAQSALSFSEASINKIWGDAPFSNSLSGGTGVGSITYGSSNTDVLTVSGTGEVTITGVGSANISATKASDDHYLQTSAAYSVTVSKAAQASLVFASPSITRVWNEGAFTNNVSGGSGTGALSWSSSEELVATVNSSGQVSTLKPGTSTILVEKAADAHYLAQSASFTLTLEKADQSLLSLTRSTLTHTVGDSLPNPVSGGESSGDLVIGSSNTAVATFNVSGEGSVVGAGESTVTVYRAGDEYFWDSGTVQYTVVGVTKPSFTLDNSNQSGVAVGLINLDFIAANSRNYVIDDDGTPALAYRLVGAPSASVLSESDVSSGSVTLDVAGRYIVAVELSDGISGHAVSDAYFVNIDTVGYSGQNPVDQLPVANGGSDVLAASTGIAVELDGHFSAVTKGSINYLWEFVAVPGASTASIQNTTAAIASFTPDLDGVYVVKLTVSDGTDSSVDIVQVYTTGVSTQVSGTIDTNTTWVLADSPYELTADLNVSATLTIEAGVVVQGNNHWIKLDTNTTVLDVNGTADLPVALDNLHIDAKNGTRPDIQIAGVIWQGGSFCHLMGDNSYRDCEGGITVTDSILLNSTSPEQYGQWTYIWYPKRYVLFERNILSLWHDIGVGIDGRNNTTNRFFIRNNAMHSLKPAKYNGFDIAMWANYGNTAEVNHNTLIDTTVGGRPGYNASFDAIHNYFPDREIATLKNADAKILPVATDESGNVPDHRKYTPYDADGDGVDDKVDNCASIANADQTDSNSDGIGDACPG